ncbi:hypothetical protein [Sulfolobus sp. S-194]|nr:hypothetical protein [Sulfolobus sp. S-194]
MEVELVPGACSTTDILSSSSSCCSSGNVRIEKCTEEKKELYKLNTIK